MNDKSILEVLNKSRKTLKDNYPKILGVVFLFLFSLATISNFPIFGLALGFFAFGFLSLRLNNYFLELSKNNVLPAESLYNNFKQIFSAFSLSIIKCFLVMLWSLLLILPGIIYFLNYSFAKFVMAENQNIDAFSALEKSRELTYGYRVSLLFLYCYFLIIIVLTFSLSMLLPLFISLFVTVPIWVLFTFSLIFTAILTVFIYYPYLKLTLADIYLEIKNSFKVVDSSTYNDDYDNIL